MLTIFATRHRLTLELDRPEVELQCWRCPACGHTHAAWLDSQTGRRVGWVRVGSA